MKKFSQVSARLSILPAPKTDDTFLVNFDMLAFVVKYLKTLSDANGCNNVGQQHAILLGQTCCIRLHGTTTMLALLVFVGTCCV